jgi:hypothetical protein
MKRRSFLGSVLASVAAPVIVRAESLMVVRQPIVVARSLPTPGTIGMWKEFHEKWPATGFKPDRLFVSSPAGWWRTYYDEHARDFRDVWAPLDSQEYAR